ncbi:MAG: Copper Transporter integral membrane protein that functions in high affinity copper transport, partial [Candelina submexicana]
MDMGAAHKTMTSMASSTKAAMSAATSSSGISMSRMDMGGGSSAHACKISMLWNWYTIDSCFLARSWHIRSAGAFAGSCIGVILLVIALEFLRRTQREFDGYLRKLHQPRGGVIEALSGSSSTSDTGYGRQEPMPKGNSKIGTRAVMGAPAFFGPHQLRLWQQIVRSGLYMLQFAIGYFVMLLAMYYN